ncbi:MAG: cobalamin-binding protein [Gammaproteobacteria bacterium]|nr:cobalamin-binding protein [Gammaproteobacteria bacterium]
MTYPCAGMTGPAHGQRRSASRRAMRGLLRWTIGATIGGTVSAALSATSNRVGCGLVGLWLIALAPASLAQIQLQDARAVTLTLPQPAARIVSLAPHLTELVYAAGAGDLLVGTVNYSDYPTAATQVPRVGSFDTVNYEALLALQPDLVIAWLSGNGAQTIARLERLGLRVFAEETTDLDAVAVSLQNLGTLTGRERRAQRAAHDYRQQLQSLRERFSTAQQLGVYYQLWNEPLMTLNDQHIISDVLRLCGGYNVFGGAIPLVSRISMEAVLRADPDVILASGMDASRPPWLDDWRAWPALRAVKNEQLYYVAPDILQRHTPRIMQGAQRVCEHLAKARAHYFPGSK